MNYIAHVVPVTPMLHAVKYRVHVETGKYVSRPYEPEGYQYSGRAERGKMSEEGVHVVKIAKDEVVDIVFQNTKRFYHTWHFHMHDFWILGYGDRHSPWTPADEKHYQLRDVALARNTFTLYPSSWTAIRVKFDNPGVAFSHCHILPHVYTGMSIAFQVGEPDDIPPPPPGTKFCGVFAKRMGPPDSVPTANGYSSSSNEESSGNGPGRDQCSVLSMFGHTLMCALQRGSGYLWQWP